MPDQQIVLDIPINKSPLPAALDMMYDFVAGISGVQPNSTDKIALFGTIVTMDIQKTARLYNDYLFRGFADRSIRVSPAPMQGAADLTDRYSYRFRDMVRLIVAGLDTSLDHAAQQQIELHQATIRSVDKERDSWLDQIYAAWGAEMQRLGLDPTKLDTDPAMRERYLERWVIFAKQRRFAQRLRTFTEALEDAEERISSIRIRAYPDDEARVLTLLNRRASAYRVIRPKSPELELKYGWDEITIQNPEYEDLEDIFDIGPLVESLSEPSAIFAGSGARSYQVKTSSTVTNNHDNSWGASGGGGFMSFISGSFSASGESHFRSTVERVRQIDISFEHVARLEASRGSWYASDIFDGDRVQAFLANSPTLRQKLALLTTALVVGRGLQLKLYFKDRSDVHEWGRTASSGSGGVRIGGFRIGGGGGRGSSWESRKIDEAEQSVTFTDGSDVCRLLGAVVSPVVPARPEELAEGARPISAIPALFAARMEEMATSNKLRALVKA